MKTYYQVLTIISTTCLLAALFLTMNRLEDIKAEAVKRGFAEWLANPQTAENGAHR